MGFGWRWRNMTQSKNAANFEFDQSFYETLKESFEEETKVLSHKTPFVEKELNQRDKERLLRRWRKSEGYYYLNPKKFNFGLKHLRLNRL